MSSSQFGLTICLVIVIGYFGLLYLQHRRVWKAGEEMFYNFYQDMLTSIERTGEYPLNGYGSPITPPRELMNWMSERFITYNGKFMSLATTLGVASENWSRRKATTFLPSLAKEDMGDEEITGQYKKPDRRQETLMGAKAIFPEHEQPLKN